MIREFENHTIHLFLKRPFFMVQPKEGFGLFMFGWPPWSQEEFVFVNKKA